eukprot:1148480-Pelagomonas_calceolata.AAC.2
MEDSMKRLSGCLGLKIQLLFGACNSFLRHWFMPHKVAKFFDSMQKPFAQGTLRADEHLRLQDLISWCSHLSAVDESSHSGCTKIDQGACCPQPIRGRSQAHTSILHKELFFVSPVGAAATAKNDHCQCPLSTRGSHVKYSPNNMPKNVPQHV